MFKAWLAARRRRNEMAEAAAMLAEDNERLRDELAAARRQLERHAAILAVLVHTVERFDAIEKGEAA